MKNNYIIGLFLLVLCYSCQSSRHNNVGISNDLFKIINIKLQKDSIFIIEATKNNLMYKILSVSDSIPLNSKKIEKGKYYDLQLKRIYPQEKSMFNLGIKIVIYGNYKFKVEKKYHYSLYKAINLDGIYLISTSARRSVSAEQSIKIMR